MYCVIRRNKDKIQKCMTETAEPVANDDKRGDGKKSELEAQYLSNVSTAPASVEVVPDNQSILRAKHGSSTGTEHRDGKCVLVLSDDDENVCEDEIIDNDGKTESEDIPITITFPLIPQESTETKVETVVSSRKYRQCHLYISRFEIEAGMWRTMLDDNGKMKTTIYPQVLSESFYPISKGCILQMNTCRMLKRNSKKVATIYAYCGHNRMTTFKLLFFKIQNGNDIEVKVFSNHMTCTHTSKKTRELSGEKGQKKKSLMNIPE